VRRLALALAAIALHASPSFADPSPSLALEPAPAGDRTLAVEGAEVRGHLLVSGRLAWDYAHDPLVLRLRDDAVQTVVAEQLWAHALLSLSLWHRLRVHLDVPLSPFAVLPQSGAGAGFGVEEAPAGAAMADVRLGARVELWSTAEDAEVHAAVAAAAAAWFPSATDGYTGDGVVRGRGAVSFDGRTSRFYWSLDTGVRSRPDEELPGILPTRVGTALTLGAAAGFFADPARHLAIGAESTADVTVTGGATAFDPRASAAHVLVTGSWRVGGGPFEVGIGIGPGLAEGAGAADYRVLGFTGIAPDEPPPPPDADDDGIPDKTDACVELAGEPSNEPLLHGCPQVYDRDGDGIPDEHDACAAVAGVPTYVRKTHGCPRPEAPPPAPPPPPTTQLVEQEIVLSQQVQFELDTAVLRPESDAVLGEVAAVLTAHPEVLQVEVQGHTDDSGTAAHNLELSQRRAESVVAWLSAHGIDPRRLVAKGYGATLPLADNTTEDGRARNRRVQFVVLGRSDM
jgi:outer membrane protein OmpA-like peptidoglycan-associated protein